MLFSQCHCINNEMNMSILLAQTSWTLLVQIHNIYILELVKYTPIQLFLPGDNIKDEDFRTLDG